MRLQRGITSQEDRVFRFPPPPEAMLAQTPDSLGRVLSRRVRRSSANIARGGRGSPKNAVLLARNPPRYKRNFEGTFGAFRLGGSG